MAHAALEKKSPTEIATEGTLCIVGSPVCGKTMLLQVLETATVHVVGHDHHDMSDIMDWHKNPLNNSPFMIQFSGQAEQNRRDGDLVNDLLVCQGLQYRLEQRQKERQTLMLHDDMARIRRLVLTGAPRTKGQYLTMKELLRHITLLGIDQNEERANGMRLQRIKDGSARPDDLNEVAVRNRWKKYYQQTKPFMDWAQSENLILMMKFRDSLLSKAIRAVNALPNLTETESSSLHKQLLSDKCEAHWLIQKIDHPPLFKQYEETVLANPVYPWHYKWITQGKFKSKKASPACSGDARDLLTA